jgi:hypothetical protein
MKMSAVFDLIFQDGHFVAVHRGLQRADRVNLGHLHARARAAQRGGRALAHVAIAADHGDLAGHHRVGGAADAVHQRFLAAVLVVELRLGDAVVDVDRREGQLALLVQVVQAMHAGGGFFRHALDRGLGLGEPAGGLLHPLLDLQLDDLFLFGLRYGQHVFACLHPGTQKDVKRGVAAIIKDHVRAFGEHEGAVEVIPMLGQGLALDGKDRDARGGNGGGGVVLGREDVARGPAHIRAQRHQRFDQRGGLDGHVQRTDDARAFQRLRRPEFLAAGHQARHLGFRDGQFLAAEVGQGDVLDDVIRSHSGALLDPMLAGQIALKG